MNAIWLALVVLLTFITSSHAEEAVSLNEKNFTAFLNDQDSNTGILLEFFANWCPTCQRFQPEYEKVAHYFNADPKVQPSIVVARVDCATEHPLCSSFKIARYPTLKYGLPTAFRHDSEVKLEEYVGERKPADIIQWLGQQKHVQYNYDPSQERQEERASTAIAVVVTESGVPLTITKEADSQDIEKATYLAFKYALDSPELLRGRESREALADFVALVASAHPTEGCKADAAKLSAELPQLWPAADEDGEPDPRIKTISICGTEANLKDWRTCRGSKENKRGYTCGLWMLLHALSGRVEPEARGGAFWMKAVKGYVEHFFQCTDCAKHFTQMASEKAAESVQSRKDAVLWGWRAHNEVNRRLEALEKNSGGGDPAFPKVQWPPSELCPLCRLPSLQKKAGVTWNEDEIYRFLLKFYQGILEPQWVTQKLKKSTQLLGMGGRKSLEAKAGQEEGSGGLLVLLGLAVLVVIGVVLWQRSHRLKKSSHW